MIEEIKNKIDLAQNNDNSTTKELEDLRRQLIFAVIEKTTFWEQKSRGQWHRDGTGTQNFIMPLQNNEEP